jgi:ribonuclease D
MTDVKKLPLPTVIEDLPALERFAKKISGRKTVAVDMESDGFYVYHEKVCLLQLTTEDGDFIIDPLKVKDLSPLAEMFRDPTINKIFHAGEYDVICLKRDFGFKIKNIFDTMVASRTLGVARLGLAKAVEKHFGVKLSKKLQRTNWGKRPLTPAHLEYARLDTHFLAPLREILTKELDEKGLLADAQDEFERLERLEPQQRIFDPNDFWHLSGARALTDQQRAVLKALYLFREKKAAQLDRAPFRVFPEQLLVRVAAAPPKDVETLRRFKGVTPYLFKNYGREMYRAIEQGLKAPPIDKPPERPPRNRWDSQTMRRYEALREWRKQLADQRGVNPVVILATDELRTLTQAPSKNPEGGNWLDCLSEHRRKAYGKEILEVLKRPMPTKKKRRRRRGKKASSSPGQSPEKPAEK